jgi:UDP-N-acetyl-D-mannosaminuronic acid transferase (WecB/TagA/CpsF family)
MHDPPPLLPIDTQDDSWVDQALSYFTIKRVTHHSIHVIKRNQEFTVLTQVPGVLGSNRYYCKALNKKKISESDIMQALLEAQGHKLPLLFFTSGTVSKKTEAQLQTLYSGILFVKI